MNRERTDEISNEIWTLLEDGNSEEAASRALAALNEDDEEPEFHYLLGLSLLDLDEVDAAGTEFARAVELDPEWADAHTGLGWSRFRSCSFEDASDAVAKALELDSEIADAHQLRGLLAERRGDEAEARAAFAEAQRLEPERFPEPSAMKEGEFLEIAQQAVAELDPEILAVLEETSLFIQDVPSDELLDNSDPPLDPQLLGLFVGRSLLEKSYEDSGALPNTMYLFQKNLERACESREELEEEIRITVLHEIGHHLGWDESELEARGLA